MYAYFALAVYPFGVTSMPFFVVFVYRENVRRLATSLNENNLSAAEFAARQAPVPAVVALRERRPSMVELSTEPSWLVSKVEDFNPEHWWMSSALPLLRLCTTSLLGMIPKQEL